MCSLMLSLHYPCKCCVHLASGVSHGTPWWWAEAQIKGCGHHRHCAQLTLTVVCGHGQSAVIYLIKPNQNRTVLRFWGFKNRNRTVFENWNRHSTRFVSLVDGSFLTPLGSAVYLIFKYFFAKNFQNLAYRCKTVADYCLLKFCYGNITIISPKLFSSFVAVNQQNNIFTHLTMAH